MTLATPELLTGQYDKIGQVLRINVNDRTAIDVTEDMARDVREHLLTMGDFASPTIRNFIEDHLGAHSADCVIEEAA